MDGALLVLFFVCAQLLLTLAILRFAPRAGPVQREPVFWFYSVWVLSLVLLALPVYKYPEKFTTFSGLYLCGFLGAYSVGVILRACFVPDPKSWVEVDHKDSDGLEMLTLICGVVGTLLLCANSYLGSGLSLSERIFSGTAQIIREQYLLQTENKIGPLLTFSNPMAALGVIGLSIFSYKKGNGAPSRGQLVIALVVLYVSAQLVFSIFFVSARFHALYLGLVVLFSYRLGVSRIKTKSSIFAISGRRILVVSALSFLLAGVGWHMSTGYVGERVGDVGPDKVLENTHRAVFDPIVHEVVADSDDAKYFLFTLSYITTPIPTLVYYLNLPESQMPGPFYGEYNFPFFARIVRRLTGNNNPISWEQARVEIFQPLAARRNGTNVWPTMARDVISDFGYIGALMFCAFFGYASQGVHRKASLTGRAEAVSLDVLLKIVGMFSGLISILILPNIHWAIYVAVLLNVFAGKITWGRSRGLR
jgi:hypothetical protein